MATAATYLDRASAAAPAATVAPARLTLVIPTLGCGGAERVLTTMANHWAGAGRSVTLLTLEGEERRPFYPLDERVKLRPLGLVGAAAGSLDALRANARRVARLRHALGVSRPGAVVSFMETTNVLTLLATRGLGVPVVVSERIDPSRHKVGRAWSLLRRLTYPLGGAIVVAQSSAALDYFPSRVRACGRVIPNPVVAPCAAQTAERRNVVVSVGRLEPQKNFALLLRAFARVTARHPEWELHIFGDGPLRAELEALRSQLGLAGCVRLPGRTTDVAGELARAGLFALPSRYEGFPNALCEAMAAGLAAVATDCPSGPRDIVRDGVDGLLVPNEDEAALAAALCRLMCDGSERARLGARAREVVERFSLGCVMEMWDEALAAAARGKGRKV